MNGPNQVSKIVLTIGASKGGEKKNIALPFVSTDRILVPDDSQFLTLVTCGQIGTLFFHRDDVEVAGVTVQEIPLTEEAMEWILR